MGLRNYILNWLTKESVTAPLYSGSNGIPGAVWTDNTYEKFADEAYLKCAVSYRCMSKIAESVAVPSWSVWRKLGDGKRERIDGHPVEAILSRANPRQTFNRILEATSSHLMINGNGWVESVGPISGPNVGVPQELWALRPDRMKVDVDGQGEIANYLYTLNGKTATFPVDANGRSNILHLKRFHPLNDWYGMPLVQPAAREIDTFNESTTWNMRLLQRDGRPGLIVKLIGMIAETQRIAIQKELNEKYSGGENAGRNMVLAGESGTGADPFTLSPKDMDWNTGTLTVARNVCMVYGVPPMLIGIPGESTFANFREADLQFVESTVFGWLNYIRAEFSNWFFGDEPLFIDFNKDDFPSMEYKREMLFKRLTDATFMTVNEKREAAGLPEYEAGKDEVDDPGSFIWSPSTLMPLGAEISDDMNDEGFGSNANNTDVKPAKKPPKDKE